MLTVAVGALAVASATACSSSGTTGTGGTGQKTPAMALSAGVQKLSDGKSASFELSIKPDAALIAAGKKAGTVDPIGDKILSGGVTLKFTASADKPLKSLKAGDSSNVEFTVASGSTNYLDVRYVGGAVYAKVNIKDGAKLAGVPDSLITSELSGGKIPPALAPAAQALVSGSWLGVSAADMKSISQLAGAFGGGDLSATPSAGNPMGLTQIPATVITALSKDATITDKGAGKLEISGKAKTIAQDLLQAADPLFANIPGGSKTDIAKMKEGLGQIPDSQTLTFDVTLKDGAVSELSIDLAQFMSASESGGGHLPLDMKISQSAPAVSAPTGVTMVDVAKLMSQMGAGL
jgi:hypothetical protein